MKMSWDIVAILIAVIVGASAPILLKTNDSLPEQVAEQFLHTQGIEIDFTPGDEDEADLDED